MARYAEIGFEAYLITYGPTSKRKKIVITDKGPRDAIEIFLSDCSGGDTGGLESTIKSVEKINAGIYTSNNFKTTKFS